MKHSWGPAATKPGQHSRHICKICGTERVGTYVGNWLNYSYSRGGTPYPGRPNCIAPRQFGTAPIINNQ